MRFNCMFVNFVFIVPFISCNLLNEGIFLELINNVFIPTMKKYNVIVFTRNNAIFSNAAYEALVPYLPNSVGLYTKISKRPEIERTNRNKNIAIAYAMLRTGSVQLPQTKLTIEKIFSSLGLDPNNKSLDLTSPIGIGNFVAKTILDIQLHDGMNQLGDMSGKKYNRRPYEDYTHYVPKNTAYNLKFPGKWQPDIELVNPNGLYIVQQYSLPQTRLAKPYLLTVQKYTVPKPTSSDPVNEIAYRKQVDEILKFSSELDDYKKVSSEFFNGVDLLYQPLMFLIRKYKLNQDEIVSLYFLINTLSVDSDIIIEQEKIKYDTVRPFSAVRYLYNNTKFRAWGGPGVGIVNDITGREWRPYVLKTFPDAEYPSGTAFACGSIFTLLSKYFKTNEFGFKIVRLKGSSVIEPKITPSTNITLGPYETFDAYIDECGISRGWAGVHFKAAIEEAKKLGKIVGNDGYNKGIKYIHGTI